MIQDRNSVLIKVFKALDFGLVIVSFVAAYFIKWYLPVDFLRGLDTTPNYYLILFLASIISYPAFELAGFYRPERKHRFRDIFLNILEGVAYTVVALVFCLFIVKQLVVGRLLIIFFAVNLIVLLTVSKGIIFYIFSRYRTKDLYIKKVLMIGSKVRAAEVIQAILDTPESGYKVVGCLEVPGQDDRVGLEILPGVKVIGTLDQFMKILLNETIDEVIFGMPLKVIENPAEFIRFAEELGIYVRIMPDFQIQKIMYRPETAKIYFEQFVGMPTIALSTTPKVEGALLVKSLIDYLGASIGLLFLSPLFLAISVLIKCSSPGPVFFMQERCGLNGRKFRLIKFRTMVVNAEKLREKLVKQNEMDGPVFKMKDDPRVTSIGKFLRRTSLDELPQLLNVLRGEMSLVGPRPPLKSEVEEYKTWQRRRLSMKPGLTCLWQVQGRNNIDFENWMRLDLEYIDNWNLLLDLRILLLTVREVLVGSGR